MAVRFPLDGPWDWKRGVFFAWLLVTIVALAPRVAGPPRCDAVSGSMVALELACHEGAAERELRAWSAASGTPPAEFLDALRRALVLDMAFLLAYSTALALAVLGIGQTLGGRFARASTPLAWMQWLAGLLDFVENGALLLVVGGRAGSTWPVLAAACAALKFLLVAAGLAFVLIGSVLVVKRLLAREPATWPTAVLVATPLGKWLTSYPLLAGTAVLLLAVLYRNALSALGIPDLFWHEQWPQQLGAGLGAGLLVADLGLVGFLVEARQPWMKELGARIPFLQAHGESARSLFAYLVVTALPLLLIVLGGVTAAGAVPVWPFVLIAPVGTVGLGVLVLFLWTRFFRGREPFLVQPLEEASRRVRGPIGVGVGGPRLDGLAWVLLLFRVALLAVIWAVTLKNPSLLPAAFALCLQLSLVASFYGFFVTFFPAWRFGVLAAMALAWVALNSASARRHQIREMEYEGSRPRPGHVHHVSLRDSGLANDVEVLRSWQALRGGSGPLVVLAVDGGGVRAATWVMSVLTQLEEDLPGFAHQVRIVTGASGGMVGAAYWTASLQPPQANATGHARRDGRLLHRAELIRRISADSLTPLAHRLVLHDLIPLVSRKGRDRGDVIGGVWVDNTEDVLDMRFRELQPGELAGWRPSLVVSPMIVEDGRRLLISNLDLEALAVRRTSRRFLSRDGLEHYRLFDDAAELKLVTAVRMSATFPYVMPSVELPTNPLRRTVDAGYYDEHGVDLATTWLLEHAGDLAAVPRVILIEVPDNPAVRGKQQPCDARASFWKLGLAGFSTPPEAIFSGRDSSAAFRNDQMIEAVEQALRAQGSDPFRSVAFEPAYEESCDVCGRPEDLVALSWRLTGGEVQRLRDGMMSAVSCEKRQQLREWWAEGGGPLPDRPLRGCPTPGQFAANTN